MPARYQFSAPLWQWQARRDAWFFVSVPDDISDEIAARSEGLTGGFNSVPVTAQVGATTWRTSIFPGALRAVSPRRCPRSRARGSPR